MQQFQCDGCGQLIPCYDIVNYGSIGRGYRKLCSLCFNTEIAKLGDLARFEHIQFEPVVMADVSGDVHEFHFRTRLMGAHVALEACEPLDEHLSGYRFQAIGDPEDDLMALLGKLLRVHRIVDITCAPQVLIPGRGQIRIMEESFYDPRRFLKPAHKLTHRRFKLIWASYLRFPEVVFFQPVPYPFIRIQVG